MIFLSNLYFSKSYEILITILSSTDVFSSLEWVINLCVYIYIYVFGSLSLTGVLGLTQTVDDWFKFYNFFW